MYNTHPRTTRNEHIVIAGCAIHSAIISLWINSHDSIRNISSTQRHQRKAQSPLSNPAHYKRTSEMPTTLYNSEHPFGYVQNCTRIPFLSQFLSLSLSLISFNILRARCQIRPCHPRLHTAFDIIRKLGVIHSEWEYSFNKVCEPEEGYLFPPTQTSLTLFYTPSSTPILLPLSQSQWNLCYKISRFALLLLSLLLLWGW